MLRRTADNVLPPLAGVTVAVAIYMVFLYAPTARGEGDVQRIFYFHVPLAVLTFVAFGIVAVASAMFLWRGSRGWDRLAHASAEVGMVFCTLVLFTGMMWARPRWNVWWTWDARLTTTLILWLIYAAYLMLRGSVGVGDQGARYAAILGIVGALDIPIINRSVYWWRTIHPAVLTMREGGSGLIDPQMQATLSVSFVAVALLYVWLVWLRYESMRLHDRVEAVRRRVLDIGPPAAATH
ncbi:cytochrome c biogenesis protein [Candidatus Binatia bacterium]|nr:cytochrome c biogenesis protein [Candidatus Binatia bacterium]